MEKSTSRIVIKNWKTRGLAAAKAQMAQLNREMGILLRVIREMEADDTTTA